MRALLTAVIAAIEAAAVALAVFALIGIPAVLVWWLNFDLGAEPEALAAAIAALWQMTHLVPMQLTVSAQTALGLGLPAAEIAMPFSLAPLALTLGTALLAYRSGSRFANRGGAGSWALVGGAAGFAVAAWLTGVLAASLTTWPQWARVVVPAAVYSISMVFGFVLRAARDSHDWWQASVRTLQQLLARVTPNAAAALPGRAAEMFRLAAAGLLSLLMLGSLGFGVAILAGYIDIITLSQGLQLDAFGAFLLFFVQLLFLPTAWVWSISWFAGSGFAVGAATSVTPFDTLLGPLPALPIFGAIPSSWGWAGGLAPVIVVAIGTVLGGMTGGRPIMRRATPLVSVAIPVCAAVLVGLVTAIFCMLASGAIGPGRLAATGPGWWQTGGLIALEFAFGMSLGVFARRFDVARLRSMVPPGLRADDDFMRGEGDPLPEALLADEQETATIEPLDVVSADSDLARFDKSDKPELEPEPEPEPEAAADSAPEIEVAVDSAAEPEPEPGVEPDAESEPAEAVDPLLQAFSWDATTPSAPAPDLGGRDWRSRMRSKLGRDE